MKIIVLNKHLKNNAIDFIRPRYIQISKYETVRDLKEKIKRCVKELLVNNLKCLDEDNVKLNDVKIFNIIYGMKKLKRKILKLLYSYNENMKKFNVSGSMISDDNQIIDVNFFLIIK